MPYVLQLKGGAPRHLASAFFLSSLTTTNLCHRSYDRNSMRSLVLLMICAGILFAEDGSTPCEEVEFTRKNVNHRVLGNILVEAEDGGILLEGRDQTIWPLQPQEILSRQRLDSSSGPLNQEELAQEILKELPRSFRLHKTKHYLICYNTSRGYAEWTGALFERLHRAFYNYWSRRGIELDDTPPLVACVFRNRKSYEAYGQLELGKGIQSVLGYYSFTTNRIAMYDLLEGRRYQSFRQINSLLRTERTVATVIHEATHQLAFNSGLHERFAAIPVWLSEGMAIYFESPDLSSSRGWKTIGKVNSVRLRQFQKFTHHRAADSLVSLVSSDERFRVAGMATQAYAESWAFCYYLIRSHPKEFAEYLRILQQKSPLGEDSPQRRLDDFRAAFGEPPQAFNDEVLQMVRRLR